MLANFVTKVAFTVSNAGCNSSRVHKTAVKMRQTGMAIFEFKRLLEQQRMLL